MVPPVVLAEEAVLTVDLEVWAVAAAALVMDLLPPVVLLSLVGRWLWELLLGLLLFCYPCCCCLHDCRCLYWCSCY